MPQGQMPLPHYLRKLSRELSTSISGKQELLHLSMPRAYSRSRSAAQRELNTFKVFLSEPGRQREAKAGGDPQSEMTVCEIPTAGLLHEVQGANI
jgi:hypothetical protein